MVSAVNIDDDFVRFGAKSYAINKINSVEVRERQPYGAAGAAICGIIGILLLFAALGSFASDQGASFGTFLFAGIFLGLAYWQWQRTKIREFLLFVMTSSSETQAFVTRDETEVMALRENIEAAIARHSRGGITV